MGNKYGIDINAHQIERNREQREVRAFRNSIRGKFILSQALTIAIKHLKKLEGRKDPYPKYGEHAEPSNRADMEYIKRVLYPMYDIVPKSNEALQQFSDGEPTTADEMNESIKETPEYKIGKRMLRDVSMQFGLDPEKPDEEPDEYDYRTGYDKWYDENSEKYVDDK